jgi:group I intron endonuclease
MATCGVYQILNTANGKKYIGSSLNIASRWNQHRRELDLNQHGNKHLQAAWNQYGSDSFAWNVVEECLPEQLLDSEQSYLPKERTIEALREGGYYNNYTVAGSPMGVKQSEESSRKKSEKLKGRKFSKEHRRKIGEANSRRVFTDAYRRKRGELNKARVVSDKEKDRLRTMNTGRKFTEEHRRKISEALRGRKKSAEHNANNAAAQKGKSLPEETRRRMSEAQRRRQARQRDQSRNP